MSAVRNVLDAAEASRQIFDVYGSAITIRETFPEEPITTDQLVDLMLKGRGGIQAIELSPPALILEIVLCDHYPAAQRRTEPIELQGLG